MLRSHIDDINYHSVRSEVCTSTDYRILSAVLRERQCKTVYKCFGLKIIEYILK
jgi:hypothetical protein